MLPDLINAVINVYTPCAMLLIVCGLCKTKMANHKKSHVIPKALYQHTRDEAGLLHYGGVDMDGNAFGTQHREPPYVSMVYCRDCEQNVFGRVDNFGVKLILKDISIPAASTTWVYALSNPQSESSARQRRLINNKVASWPLFLISVLYRANDADHELFRDVNLGMFKEMIRLSLQKNNIAISRLNIRVYTCQTMNDTALHLIMPPYFKTEDTEDGSGAMFIHGMLILFTSIEDPEGVDNTPATMESHFDFLEVDIEEMNDLIEQCYHINIRDSAQRFIEKHSIEVPP